MNGSNILILEDDPDQMDLLVEFAVSEVLRIRDDKNTSDRQRKAIKEIKIIKVGNIDSLKKSVSMLKNVFLAVLDCNTPDDENRAPHDQLVKTDHIVTGQHKSVDIVAQLLPGTPITMISSMGRFKRIVKTYYESRLDLRINFVAKNDSTAIKQNIETHLQEYLKSVD